MKLSEKINEVLRTGDAKEALKVATAMRMVCNYNQMMAVIAKVSGRPLEEVQPEWEALLLEAESQDEEA